MSRTSGVSAGSSSGAGKTEIAEPSESVKKFEQQLKDRYLSKASGRTVLEAGRNIHRAVFDREPVSATVIQEAQDAAVKAMRAALQRFGPPTTPAA